MQRITARTVRILVSGVACAFACAATAGAQDVRGTVVESASGRPVAGAVVLLLGAGDSVLVRGITSARGTYRLPLAAGARRVQLRRIGFRPRTLPLPAGDAPTLDVALVVLPTLLEPVRVADGSTCPRRADRPAALGLWEQARTALLATIVARDARPDAMKRLAFQRVMDGDDIVRQDVRLDTVGRTTRPYVSVRSADAFVRTGFVDDGDDGATFHGPDADVLVDEAFALGYCLHLAGADRARPSQVGLAFQPARRQRGRIDIVGTLWVDTAARALRDVEFRYVGLDRALDAARPGGRVSFRELPNGLVFVDRWALRVPNARADTAYPRGQPQVRAWVEPREIGGEVARARWPDGTAWRGALATLRLDAVTSEGRPAAWADVLLVDSDYRGSADAAGRIEIPDLLPGPYVVELVEPALVPVHATIPLGLGFAARADG